MAKLNVGDRIMDNGKFGVGRIIYTKGNDALVEYVKPAPQLLPGIWSIKHMMTVGRNKEGKRIRKPNPTSFGAEDHCFWYDRNKNNLEVVLFPDKIKKESHVPGSKINQTIVGNNNTQAAGDVVVVKAG